MVRVRREDQDINRLQHQQGFGSGISVGVRRLGPVAGDIVPVGGHWTARRGDLEADDEHRHGNHGAPICQSTPFLNRVRAIAVMAAMAAADTPELGRIHAV
jgi:hypothetical protein